MDDRGFALVPKLHLGTAPRRRSSASKGLRLGRPTSDLPLATPSCHAKAAAAAEALGVGGFCFDSEAFEQKIAKKTKELLTRVVSDLTSDLRLLTSGSGPFASFCANSEEI
jgi:hypothetical protein